jgi:predicted dehydrogenase
MTYDKAELVALVDTAPSRLRAAMDNSGVLAGYADVEELLSSTELDGVIVATSSAAHYAVTKAVLEAGVHALVEKPMTLRARDAWELVRAAAEHGLHLTVGYTHNFTASAQRLHEVVSTGGIGQILQVSGLYASAVEAYYRGQPDAYGTWREYAVTGPEPSTYSDPLISGGGQAQTQLTHAIGMILWVTGRRVEQVSAFMQNTDLEVDLVDAISFRLDNGGVGSLGSTGNLRAHEPQQQEIRYYGTDGFAIQDLSTATHQIFYADGASESIAAGESGDPYPHAAPARCFADLISGRWPDWAPGELGARAVELVEAAYASVASNARIDLSKVAAPERSSHSGEPYEKGAEQ